MTIYNMKIYNIQTTSTVKEGGEKGTPKRTPNKQLHNSTHHLLLSTSCENFAQYFQHGRRA